MPVPGRHEGEGLKSVRCWPGCVAIDVNGMPGMAGGHVVALTALPYLPVAVVALLLSVDVAARLDVHGARACLAAYQRAPGSDRLVALLLATSAVVHLAMAPAHAQDPVRVVLFVLDAAALGTLAAGTFVLSRWRPLAALLLAANLVAYAGYVAAGRETVDVVGLGTQLVEVGALALLAVRPDPGEAPVGKEVGELMNLSRTYAVAFGVVYTIVGLIGFAFSTTLATANLLVFPVNVLHNVVHLAVGLLGVGAFLTGRTVPYARAMAVLFAVLTLAGFLPQPLLGLVPLGGADIVLHALTAILAGVAGWAYSSGAARRAAA